MCGRYRLSRRKQIVQEYFGSDSDEQDWEPRYNIAPTQPVPVIRQNPKEPIRELSLMRWGLSYPVGDRINLITLPTMTKSAHDLPNSSMNNVRRSGTERFRGEYKAKVIEFFPPWMAVQIRANAMTT